MTSDSALVFVHGLFGPFRDPAVFGGFSSMPCSAPDLEGYGLSSGGSVTYSRQVDAVRTHIQKLYPDTRVHLVAHSIGAVYAFAVAEESPDLVASVTTVEGNFTLADAFWSRSIAQLDEQRARAEIEARLGDPEGFLEADEIVSTPAMLAKATEALTYQPWQTVWDSAKAVVEVTSSPEYLSMLQRVFARHPVHLVAGERSVGAWDVPTWAREAARSMTVIPDVGHMMMLESPESFARALQGILKIT